MYARVFALSMLASLLSGQVMKPMPLWPGAAPGGTAGIGEEHDTTDEKGRMVAGGRVMRIGQISVPTMTLYKPANGGNGTTVVVFPGGGYQILAYDLEGTEVCEWLNKLAVTCALVKYRVPAPKPRERYAPALEDAQRAIGLLRAHALEWGIKPDRIGVLGFSAGGHLSASVSTHFDKRVYEPVDAADKQNTRPDFAVIVYPGYLADKANGDRIMPDLVVSPQTPPTILIQATDDPVRVENSITYYNALRAAKVPVEMHLYPTGGHGYGLRRTEETVTTWPDRVADWMRSLGYLKRS